MDVRSHYTDLFRKGKVAHKETVLTGPRLSQRGHAAVMFKGKRHDQEESRPRLTRLLGICPWKNFGNLIRRKWGVAKELMWLLHRKPADGGTAS